MKVNVNLDYVCQLLSHIFLYICIAAYETYLCDWWSQCSVERAGLRVRPARQLHRLPTYKEC